ncbi:fibrillin-2, partial [Lingula anatina]|uniref:Fibrillin-2 n=1 Tax=Lingula anatina TaxID=7574 RepID=A0A1S3HVF1_LINAN
MVQVTGSKWTGATLMLFIGMSIPCQAQDNPCGEHGQCKTDLDYQVGNVFGCFFYNLIFFGGTCNNEPPSTCECVCLNGFKTDAGGICVDIDECTQGIPSGFGFNIAVCTGFNCVNSIGSYRCGGDLDECSLGTDNCAENATCTNTVGSFTCSCLPGFTGDGTVCNDIDECSLGTDNCAENASCTNTVGSFSCTCFPNYNGDGTTCDPDECSLGTDNCAENATCTDTVGSFSCSCLAGFTGDGTKCNDVDECTLGTDNCE